MYEFLNNKIIDKNLSEFNLILDELKATYSEFPQHIFQYILSSKGKQIRPLLTFLSANLFGDNNSTTQTAALIIELMHSASLLHDDVIDEAKIRRGIATINHKWDNKTAIMAGDFIFALAMKIATERNEHKLFDIISKAVMDLSLGEIKETEFSNNFSPDIHQYLEIIYLKTASLIACCFECGSFSVGASIENINLAKEFGKIFGLIFQIKDDILDYCGTNTGKEKGIDIKGKKLTLPLILAYQNMDINLQKQIKTIWNQTYKSVEDINFIINKTIEFQGITKSNEILLNYKYQAESLLLKFENKEISKIILFLVMSLNK